MTPSGTIDFYSREQLRRNTIIFAFGRVVNSGLTFVTFVLLASKLPIQEFALYAWLLAFIRVSQWLSYFGVNVVAARYIPYYRTRLDSDALGSFVLSVVGCRIVLVLTFGGGFLLGSSYLLSILGSDEWSLPFKLFLLVFVAEAIAECLRSDVFGTLLRQLYVQVNLFVRNGVFISLLLFFGYSNGFSIYTVIYCEIAATALAALLGIIQLGCILRNRARTIGVQLGKKPGWRNIVEFAANNYVNDVLQLSGSGQVLILLGSHLLSVSSLAAFGFAFRLSLQLERLVPVIVLQSLISPALFARYIEEGSFEKLNRQATLALKISNCVIAVGATIFIAYGRPILELLSAGKYTDTYYLMLVLGLFVTIRVQKRVLTLVINALERPAILRRASVALLLVPPAAVFLAITGAGPLGFATAMVVGELVFVAATLRQLRKEGFDYTFDHDGHARIGASMLCAALVAFGLVELLPMGASWDLLGIVVTAIVFAVGVRAFRAFNDRERRVLERLVGRRIYVL